jgi:hypothetical protein
LVIDEVVVTTADLEAGVEGRPIKGLGSLR